MRTINFWAAVALGMALALPVQSADKSAGNVVDDSTITAAVKEKLLSGKETPGLAIKVETYKGKVLLSGWAETDAQKVAAGEAAAKVDNVKDVRNAISVHGATSMGTKLDDTVLTTKVKSALIETKGVSSGQINVETKGGIVQLGGYVDTAEMRDKALQVAKGVKGVTRVDDALLVRAE